MGCSTVGTFSPMVATHCGGGGSMTVRSFICSERVLGNGLIEYQTRRVPHAHLNFAALAAYGMMSPDAGASLSIGVGTNLGLHSRCFQLALTIAADSGSLAV